jgi:type I restriction enzyme M protein
MARNNMESTRNAVNMNFISPDELDNWLYGAADILRGPINAADFKTYIFPLLFLKRICDMYDEEYEEATKSNGEMFPENYRFIIPDGCHWRDIRARSENIGQSIITAMQCIEKANPDLLWGIFGDADWSNKEVFTDELLKDLIEHFSKHRLSMRYVDVDMAGRAYEYLIKRFADESNKAAGEYYTPRPVIRLLMRILKPHEGESVYDSCAGTGGMLLEGWNYVKAHGGNVHLLHLFGQESNLTTASIARMNLILHGIEDFKIVRGDTLREPKFFEGDRLATFNCCCTNPPFSLGNWGSSEWRTDPYGRNSLGQPPEGYGDYAFVLHNINSMAPSNGRMAIILPQGALFRKGSEAKIREKLIIKDLLEAVIGFAPNVFSGTTLAACALVFRAEKDEIRKNKVQFIDASSQFRTWKNHNELLPKHVDKIYEWYNALEDIPGVANIATLDDIREKDFNLNISLYVEPAIEEVPFSEEEAFVNLLQANKERRDAEQRLITLLREEGIL